MQGMTIALLMQEQLSQVRASSLASQRERAALELRRIEKEGRPRSTRQPRQAAMSAPEPFLGFVPRLVGHPFHR
jgi:hypothetical protein